MKWLVGEGETQNHVRLTVAITHILNVLTSVCSSVFEWKRRALERSCNYSLCGQSDLPWHGCPVWVGVGYLADSCALKGGNVQWGVFTLHADSALPVFFQLVSTPQQTITACRNIHVTSALFKHGPASRSNNLFFMMALSVIIFTEVELELIL